MTLSDQRVDLWLVLIEEAKQAGLLSAYRELLAPQEREREQRFRRLQDRNRFVVSRALLRCTLSRYVSAPVPAQAWRLVEAERGKPYLAPSSHFARFQAMPRFNLTHTDDLVLMAVTLRHDVGVDAEPLARDLDSGVVDQCLTRAERAGLQALPVEARARRFTQIWTLKEAYVKARGDGLSLPLQVFEFSFPEPGPPVLHAADDIDDGRAWRFVQFLLPGDHIGALCVASAAAFEIVLRRTVPLVAQHTAVELDVI